MNQKHMDWISIEIHMGLNISWRECLVSYTWNWWKPKCGKFSKTYLEIPYVLSSSQNTKGLFSLFRKSVLKGRSYLFFNRKELRFNKQASNWRYHAHLLIRRTEDIFRVTNTNAFSFSIIVFALIISIWFLWPQTEVSKDKRMVNEISCWKFS